MEKRVESLGNTNFYINKIEDVPADSCLSSYRRDFYKISLITQGKGVLSFRDKTIDIVANTLIISNPTIPFLWKPTTEKQTGFFCLFSKNYLNNIQQNNTIMSLLNGNEFVFPLKQDKAIFFTNLFYNMYLNAQVEYVLKDELLRSYIQLILNEVIKEFEISNIQSYSSPERINRMFQNLLDSHMLVNSISSEIILKTPQEYAKFLSVHVNHLNRVLKEYTGKTTSELIKERIVVEAKSLLVHTDWNISEIAYCLGFKHPSSFQAFFKKQTTFSPKDYRKSIISLK